MGLLTTTDPTKTPRPLLVDGQAQEDLMLKEYMDRLFSRHHEENGKAVLDWTQFLTTDEEDLAYRREVLTELSASPTLVEKMDDVCKTIGQIHQLQEMPPSDEFYAESMRDFEVLPLAQQTMQALDGELDRLKQSGKLTSRGLNKLSDLIKEKLSSNFSASFQEQWKTYASGLQEPGSYRVRFTMDDRLQVCGAALTHVQKEKFVKNALLSHTLRENQQKDKPWDLGPLREMKTPAEELVHVQLSNCQKQFSKALERITQDLDDLYTDLRFYLGALLYIRQMKRTWTPVCFASIRPMEEKAFDVQEMYNPVLTAFKQDRTVPNNITFRPGGEILVLTGINQGGKTTFLRAVGVVQALFQLGWPVPCRSASISPAERIVTVFSHEENTNLQHGKLGQELKTMRAALDKMTPHSLLLCNEPITGTSPMENLYLSREVLSSCKLLGYRGIWVTHIYDLASSADEMNKEMSGSTISSIIAVAVQGEDGIEASYHIQRGQPQFTSYAKEVLLKKTGNLLQ